jgi:hypothetical protein
MSNQTANQWDYTWPGPWVPDLPTQAMPETVFDTQVQETGIRFGWLKAHSCPCTMAIGGKYGTPNPACITCHGRGVYWDSPVNINCLLTFMHTTAAPDEPGAMTSETLGHLLEGQPVITIPFGFTENEQQAWLYASSFDAFVEYDAVTRYNSVFVVGQQQSLPYQWGAKVLAVTAYATGTNQIAPVASTNYTLVNGAVTLNSSLYPTGTAYTVEYTASPVFVAYRPSGGIPHARPFAQGRTRIPRRFHIMSADAWIRNRFGGESPGSGIVPSGPCR